MRLTLTRNYKGGDYTIGSLAVDGVAFCDTLEDTDRGLDKTMTPQQVVRAKIRGRTAIPSGTYALTLKVRSPKFSQLRYAKQYAFCEGRLPRLLGVPGFDGVLIHCGNDASHTDGCVLVGRNTAKGRLTSSTETFKSLYRLLEEADKRGETLSLTIQ